MPIYEYVCSQCGKMIDVLQKLSDPAPTKCEHCGAEATLTKVLSRSSFVLKGGGWGSDLYGSQKKDAKKDEPSSSPASSTATATPPSAPAASGSSTTSTSGSTGTQTSSSGTGSTGTTGGDTKK